MSKLKGYVKAIKEGKLKELKRGFSWIYGYGKNHVISIVVYTLLGLTGTVVGLFSSLVSRDLVDIITGHQSGELIKSFVMIIVAQLVSVAVTQGSLYLSTWLGLRVENSIKADVYDQIMQTEWEAISEYHSGELAARWSGDVSHVSNGILNIVPNAIIYVFKFAASLYMVCKYDASFAIFAVLSVPISLLASRGNLRRMRKTNMSGMEINAKMSAFTQESFANTQNVKALDMVSLYQRKLRVLQKDNMKIRMKYTSVSNFNSIIITLTTILVTYSTYGWGIYKVWNGSISYGTMTMFLGLSTSLSTTIQSMISLVPSSLGLVNAATRILKIIDLPKEDTSKVDDVKEFYERHKEEGVGLSLSDISYAYKTGTQVFDNVALEAHPREVVALIGPSGEGKTTMLRLLLSLITAKKGEGYILEGMSKPGDAGEYMELNASCRQLFAYVPQGNTMFSGTIAENMRNVKEDATDEEIIDALKLADAWGFVSKLSDGIQATIKERGGGFSEGQAQRLSIARALIRKSPILLLDEATSALDYETEKRVLDNICKDAYPRTVLITTHRPQVMDYCNRAYVIHDLKVEGKELGHENK